MSGQVGGLGEAKGARSAENAETRRSNADIPREVRSMDIVGAIRLAMEGAADETTAVRVIVKLCEYAPATPSDATGPTQLLIDALRDTDGRLTVAGERRFAK